QFSVAQAIDHTGKGVLFPMSYQEGIAIFGLQAAGPAGDAEYQLSRRYDVKIRTHPTPANDAQPPGWSRREFEIVHQAVDGSEPRAKTRGGGKPVGHGLFHVSDSGTV